MHGRDHSGGARGLEVTALGECEMAAIGQEPTVNVDRFRPVQINLTP